MTVVINETIKKFTENYIIEQADITAKKLSLNDIFFNNCEIDKTSLDLHTATEKINDEVWQIVLLFEPYTPYLHKIDTFFIDAYYFASNALYKKKQQIIASLCAAGFAVNQSTQIGLKQLAKAMAGATIRRNTLSYFDRFGSRVAIEGFLVKTQKIVDTGSNLSDCFKDADKDKYRVDCDSCKACEKACPTGAISPTGVCRDKCLRQYQDDYAGVSDPRTILLEDRILGCDICQGVCPAQVIKPIDMPPEIAELLDIEKLFKSLLNGRKKIGELGDKIGKNYARVQKLFVRALGAIGNTADKKYLPLLISAKGKNAEWDKLIDETIDRVFKK